jgi:hypothetical protein
MQVMRLSLIVGMLVGFATGASAQPYAPPPSPSGPPATAVPAPYAYRPRAPITVALTQDQQELLARGEISDAQYLGGAAASLLIGFGVGQAVQGRWGDTGWIFTFGELGGIVAVVAGATQFAQDCVATSQSSCTGGNGTAAPGIGLIIGGALAIVGLHIWEVIDAFVGPPSENRELRELRGQLGMPVAHHRVAPYVAPLHGDGGGGGVAGIALRF